MLSSALLMSVRIARGYIDHCFFISPGIHPKDGNCSVCWNVGRTSAIDSAQTQKL